nr:MAG: hypothetical protein [Microvirus sp.]
MIGAFIGAAGSIIGGVSQAKAASKAAKKAGQDRMAAVRMSEEDYRNNMAQRDRDQRDLDAISDDMQMKYDRARDFDQQRADAYRDIDQARNDAYRDRDQMVADALAEADQARAIEYARSDEARMVAAHKEAVGYDLGKLVADAKAAGFNPLTVLGATGGANYAREAAPVVTTPFIAKELIGSTVVGSQAIGSRVAERSFAPRPLIDRAGIFAGASGNVAAAQSDKVQSAGYIGDTIGALGSAYASYTTEQARLASEADLAEAIRAGGSVGRAVGGSARKPGAIMTARVVDARPVGNVPSTGMVGPAVPSQGTAGPNDLKFGGSIWRHAPDTSVMDDVETVYGDSEIVSTIGAIGVGARDVVYNWNLARNAVLADPNSRWNRLDRYMQGLGNWLTPAPGGSGDMLSVGP